MPPDDSQSFPPHPLEPPDDTLRLFRLLWQFENWLREMAYVEFRARDVNWEQVVNAATRGKGPPRSMASDKALRHMATMHTNPLSYLTTGELKHLIRDPKNWPLFEDYFPPGDVLDGRFKEISQIRHRVAHFRGPNERDLERVRLFLKDLDNGIRGFCTSYVGQEKLPDAFSDPVAQHFIDTHHTRYIVEMIASGGRYQYAKERHNPRLHFALSWSIRPWAKLDGHSRLVDVPGVLYHARFDAFNMLRVSAMLDATTHLHKNCVHVRLETENQLEIAVPAVLGEQVVIQTIEGFLDTACQCVSDGSPEDPLMVASRWPEMVLPPKHPLGLIGPDQECSMFSWG